MKDIKEYSIPFVGLKQGVHYFDFEIGEDFFVQFENSLITKSNANVLLTFEKKDDFFILKFDVGGTVNVECDRCLEPFDMEFEGIYTIYVRYEDERDTGIKDEDVDVMYISRNETHIDVAQLIYEFINLSLPMQKIHPDDKEGNPGCNETVLKYISGKGDNKKEKGTDPRWKGLENIEF